MRKPLAVLMVLTAVMTGCSDSKDDSSGPTTSTAPAWNPTPNLEYREPQQVMADGNGNVAMTLDAATRTIEVSGQMLQATPYAATVGGSSTPLPVEINAPTLHVGNNGTITVTIKNNLDQLTNIHYHGLHVSPSGDSDNVFRDMPPGGEYKSVVKLENHPVGTYWYHVHHHGNSAGQVNGGLSGMLIVEGVENVLPPQYRGIVQRQFALREITTNGGGLAPPTFSPTARLVNGLLTPRLSIRQNETQLWRFANIGPDIFYYLRMQDHKFTVVAQDGNPLFNGQTFTTDLLALPPGKRFDVLVTGGAARTGGYKLQSTDYDPILYPTQNPTYDLATVIVEGSVPQAPAGRATVNAPDDGLRSQRTDLVRGPNRTFTFMKVPTSSGGGTTTTSGHMTTSSPTTTPSPTTTQTTTPVGNPTTTRGAATGSTAQTGVCPAPPATDPTDFNWGINGQLFDPQRLDVAVRLGTTETWTLCNTTSSEHPFHIHVNEFQVVSVNGKRPAGPQGYEDVVIVPARYTGENGQMVAGQVVVQNIYRTYTGKFVFHCHILIHEDDGMMMSIEVFPPGASLPPAAAAGGTRVG